MDFISKRPVLSYVIILLIICLLLIFIIRGNTKNPTNGLTNVSNIFNYILTFESEQYYLHEVETYCKIVDSDTMIITTKCCDNQFWTSYNSAILYTNKPTGLNDDVIICGR